MRLFGFLIAVSILFYLFFPGLFIFGPFGILGILILGIILFVSVKLLLVFFSLLWMIILLPFFIVFSIFFPVVLPLIIVAFMFAIIVSLLRDRNITYEKND